MIELDAPSEFTEKILKSLENWRFERDFVLIEVSSESSMNSVSRQTEPDVVERLWDGTILTRVPLRTDSATPTVVTIENKHLAEATTQIHLVRLLTNIGQQAAFREHEIIIKSLFDEGVAEETEIDQTKLEEAIEKVSEGTFSEVTILISPWIKRKLTNDAVLVPKWKQPRPELGPLFAGTIFGCNAFWTGGIENETAIVIRKYSVGIKRTAPRLLIHPDTVNPTTIRFREEMISWVIYKEAVRVLKH